MLFLVTYKEQTVKIQMIKRREEYDRSEVSERNGRENEEENDGTRKEDKHGSKNGSARNDEEFIKSHDSSTGKSLKENQ